MNTRDSSAAVDRVRRRILEDDGSGWDLDTRLDQLENATTARDERLPILQTALDVVVPARGVEVVRLVVVERRFFA